MKNNIRHYLKDFQRKEHIVFYIEESSDWGFLFEIYAQVSLIVENTVVLTSDNKDPHLNSLRNIYYVGRGFRRVSLFRRLNCTLLVTTLTDLHNLQLKKSVYNVKYVYIFHSLASTTAVYLKDAFRHYDYIFCAGPHQLNELRSYFEEVTQNPILVEHGYVKIDKLARLKPVTKSNTIKTILIAPSWGSSSINDFDLKVLIKNLILNYRIVIRFHPMHLKKRKKFMKEVAIKYPSVIFQNNTNDLDDLINSDILITDWSGVAIEFGLGLRKPVISINYPQKLRNSQFLETQQTTFENSIRSEIGIIVEPADIANISIHVHDLILKENQISDGKNKSDFIYNLGESVKIASQKIVEIFNSLILH